MIRPAKIEDTAAIMRMAAQFIEEHFQGKIADNAAQVERLSAIMMGGDDRLLLVNEDGGRVNGMIAMFLFDHPISGERIAGELAWWVDPAARGRAGLQLMRQAEQWAANSGAVRLQMVAPARSLVGKTYERLGYEEVETTYTRRLK